MRDFTTFDYSRMPIVIIKVHDFVPTLDEFVQNQVKFERLVEQNENCAVIMDLTDVAFLPSQYRIALMKWHVKKEDTFLKQKLRLAFYTPSLVSQLVMKAIFVTTKPRVPYAVISTFEKAEAWAVKQLNMPYPEF